jgi:soluble lytic murein transglycosylase-like protein
VIAKVLLMAALAVVTCAVAQTPPRAADKHKRDVIRNARLEWGLDAPIAALAAQLEQESGWNPAARSPVGALGIAQFMPGTAADMARKLGAPSDPLNPAWALRAHSAYMRQLYNLLRYPTECDNFGATLSAYNGGLGWHNRRRAVAPDPSDFWTSVRWINPGITEANQLENENYSVRIVYNRQANYVTWGRTVCL